jgi:predicted AAA+ superfamily ATPase
MRDQQSREIRTASGSSPYPQIFPSVENSRDNFCLLYKKGIFDSRSPEQRILVTGSARLDLYRYSGDSLQGRYHMLRLHPLSVAELGLELRYFRDSEGREVDFVVVDRGVPIMMVESKISDSKPDRSLRYLRRRFPGCPAWQISATGNKDYLTPEGIRVCPAVTLLKTLV